MDSRWYRNIATDIAERYLKDETSLLEKTAMVVREKNVTLNPDELHRLAEYVNGAVQVGLFSRGRRLEGFPLLDPDDLMHEFGYANAQSSNPLEISNDLPETNVTIPVTVSPLERELLERAKSVKQEEDAAVKAQKDKVFQKRLEGVVEDLKNDDAKVNGDIVNMVSSIIGDIVASNDVPSRVRIIRIRLGNTKLASLIENEVEKRTGIKMDENEKTASYGEPNPDNEFVVKIASLEDMVNKRNTIHEKLALYTNTLIGRK